MIRIAIVGAIIGLSLGYTDLMARDVLITPCYTVFEAPTPTPDVEVVK